MSLSFIPTKSHSRRRLSAESFFKSWFEDFEYLLLIVDQVGIEPTTFWLWVNCSNRVSYKSKVPEEGLITHTQSFSVTAPF